MRNFLLGGVAALALVGAAAILTAPSGAPQAASSETYRQLNLFGDVFERIRADYVDKVDDQQMMEAAINGMLASLDPHSSYMNPKAYKDMQQQTRGEFGGLGIEVTMENGLVKVVAPIDETPAARAGIKPGDLITHLDGQQIMGLTLAEAVDKMRGPVNSSIGLTIRREGSDKPIEVTLTRAIVKVQSVRYRREGDIGYVKINTFTEQTIGGLRRAVDDLKAQIGAQQVQGYVLDLRRNPGGLLDQAIQVSDAFLEQGEIVSTRSEKKPNEGQRYNATRGDITGGKPVVVLIDGGSASASEIVAGALQDHHRAVIMGTKSFGKGSVQTIFGLAGQGALRMTTAKYYTPSGRSIQALGIDPDIEVQQAKVEVIDVGPRRSEADLRNHLNNPNAVKVEKPAANTQDAEAQADYQLQRALDLLRGVALFAQPRNAAPVSRASN
jgi:carboxyl-terminal processing protease